MCPADLPRRREGDDRARPPEDLLDLLRLRLARLEASQASAGHGAGRADESGEIDPDTAGADASYADAAGEVPTDADPGDGAPEPDGSEAGAEPGQPGQPGEQDGGGAGSDGRRWTPGAIEWPAAPGHAARPGTSTAGPYRPWFASGEAGEWWFALDQE